MNIQRIWYEYRKNILNLNQDTLDVRLPQGAALIFQQKGMLHAGLGQNFHFLDYFLDFQIFMLHAELGQTSKKKHPVYTKSVFDSVRTITFQNN